jgi:protein-S-isoprenylcysteine O-methyltransferase Ste14
MKIKMEDWKKDKKMLSEMISLTTLMVTQIVLFIIFFNYGKVSVLKYIGYFCWALSAIFGWLPIYEFKKKGKVPKGRSYVSTTKLVTSGIYSIVRHPQFLAGILFSLAFILISQHWSVLILGVPITIVFYKDMFDADKSNTRKFDKAYTSYMKKVPRMNFILGLIRIMKDK